MKFNYYKREPASNYDPQDILRGFETIEKARKSRRQLWEALSGKGSEADQLAALLKSCKMGTRCRSAACPICVRRFRQVWCSRIAKCLDNNAGAWCAVSIVPSELAVPVGELARFKPAQAKDRLRKQLDRSDLAEVVMIGGFDYALQTFNGRAPKWRPHFYILAQTSSTRVKSAIGSFYSSDEDTKKPILVRAVEPGIQNAIRAATYTYKAEFYQRKPGVDVRGNADTHHVQLEPAHRAELAAVLHQQGTFGRAVRRGHHPELPELKTR